MEGRVRPAQQLEGRGELRGLPDVHLQRRTDDNAYHLGYDLSVTKNYPVEASNSGTVAFTGDLGIYGNAVILDHGLGLFSLYGHLSSIDVKAGDSVAKRQVLGKTGETGLAAGDHFTSGSTSMASRCCPWSGGTRSGSTTTSSPSWKDEAGRRSRRRSSR